MTGFFSEAAPLRPGGECASCLYEVGATSGFWKVHRVNVSLSKEGWEVGDCWRDEDLFHLSLLALVTGLNKPLNVLFQHGPPEPLEETFADDEDALVAEVIVGLNKEEVSGV